VLAHVAFTRPPLTREEHQDGYQQPPLYAPSKNQVARRWQAKLGEFDAFIFTAAEYNHGPTAVLKNALDYAYAEWSNKPVGFVGYGEVGGARAVEQLRLHAIELLGRRSAARFTFSFPIIWPWSKTARS
jgi:NAD(P)H-dependent FMN reductase